jgi:copper(I)-binding protein
MKRTLMLACVAALAVAGCGDSRKSDSPADAPKAAESGAPDAKPGLTVADGMLILPAVKGNPGVAYFSITNGNDSATSLAAVSVEGVGKAEMHETKGDQMVPMSLIPLEDGETVRFERGGKHVMLFDLAEKLKPGGTTEMTLTFSGGDKLSTPLKIEAAGSMAGMDHGDMATGGEH